MTRLEIQVGAVIPLRECQDVRALWFGKDRASRPRSPQGNQNTSRGQRPRITAAFPDDFRV
jgi:hypothetical protein